MPTTTLISDNLLSLEAVELGRLVLNVKHPEQDFYQSATFPISQDDIIIQRLEKFQDILLRTTGSRFHALLSGAFSTTSRTRKDSKIDIYSALCSTYQLKNSGDFFHKICKLESAQDWLERAIRRRKSVYLVVGIKTLTDAHISKKVERLVETGGAVQLSGAVSVAPTMGSISIKASQSKELDKGTNSFAPGEQIYAVQYRKIEFSWFSSRGVGDAFPEDRNRWEVYLGVRGGEVENDIVEAELHDYLQKDDLEGPCESFHFGDDELLYLL